MRLVDARDRGAVTGWRHLRAILLLPVTNTIMIPALIIAWTKDADLAWLTTMPHARDVLGGVGGVALLGVGVVLVYRAIGLIACIGEGTLAPWDPARVLITEGVYRHVRNPMKTGLFMILCAECVLLNSLALTGWLVLFMLVNMIYIRASEEPGLRARFGNAYDAYCASVPRWLPRLRAWMPERAAQRGAVP